MCCVDVNLFIYISVNYRYFGHKGTDMQGAIFTMRKYDIQVQYQIEAIVSHRFKSHSQSQLTSRQIQLFQKPLPEIPDEELEYLVKWVGHDQNSWQPGQNLKNAPQILESYKNFYSQNKDMSTLKNTTSKTRGRKPKNTTGTCEKSRTSKRRNLNFSKIYKESENMKLCEDEEDELEIIDKETYIKGIKETPNQQYYTKTIKCQEDNIEHNRKLKKKAEKIDQEPNSQGIDLNYYNIDSNGREQRGGQSYSNKELIVHQSISSNPLSPIKKKECPFEREPEENIPLLQPLNQVRERSIMITQQQKFLDEENTIKNDKPKEKTAQSEFASPTQQLISLFVNKRQKEKVGNPPKQNAVPIDSYQSINNFKYDLTPLIQPVERQSRGQIEQQRSLKRNFNNIMGAQAMDQHLIKKIKPNQDQRQRKPVVTIDIQDDESIDRLRPEKSKPLCEKIQKQINYLLEDNLQIDQILKDSDQPQEENSLEVSKDKAIGKEDRCKNCKHHQDYNNQLRYLFNELLQTTPQINLDNLFLEQQTFSVLSSLNPNSYPFGSSSLFLRTDKMTDISDNSSFRLLISRKIVSSNDIPQIKKYYSLQKLIKMGDEWVAIFKLADLAQRREHFKYVLANDLLRLQRRLIVSFLKK